jgi:hypothetical protein
MSSCARPIAEAEVTLKIFLTLELYGSEWWISLSGRLYPRRQYPHKPIGQETAEPRPGLDVCDDEENHSIVPGGNQIPTTLSELQ